ncbi:MAG TPA: aromatic ring-hydroxylating dioxygenase subunit alpha [Candidatus Limnocylindria bacterium]|jgi:phenylpropionate dioxygenase-like ring-hydroxylating dioxygenase large terminal subunit|nr:aromatic ring-hydroxylating dioxygenase subunit alpha [Candidatus Limnocylindria bacterium]
MPRPSGVRGSINPRANLPDEFVYDAWYVAAWGEEITRTPMRRVILDEPIAFYRRGDGTPAALADRCVHRAFPLSASGKLEGDQIVCGYHGFKFQPDGACTWVPGQASVPRSARVRAYPLVESGPFVWIWMGEPDAANPAAIPDHHWAYDPEWRSMKDMATVKARYALVVDNLLDLSHEAFIHAATIGSSDVAETPITTQVDGTIVRCWRHMENVPVPPSYQRTTGITTTIDRWQDIEYAVPAFYTLHVRVAPAGAGDDQAYYSKVMYALTPETARSTHDFWVISRRSGAEQPAWMTAAGIKGQNTVLGEDIAALELLERSLPADGHWQELSINNDRGGLQWRRVFRELLSAQKEVLA